MSLFEEKKGNIVQELFQAGNKKYYLRNKDKPDSIHVENVLKSLEYLKTRQTHYSELEIKIASMLPQPERDQYFSKMIESSYEKIDLYTSSLSDPEKQQYLSKGKKTAEDQTRLRLPKIKSQLGSSVISQFLKNVNNVKLCTMTEESDNTWPIGNTPIFPWILVEQNTLILFMKASQNANHFELEKISHEKQIIKNEIEKCTDEADVILILFNRQLTLIANNKWFDLSNAKWRTIPVRLRRVIMLTIDFFREHFAEHENTIKLSRQKTSNR